MSSMALVGNRTVAKDVSDAVEACEVVVRMGTGRSLDSGKTGKRTDILAVRVNNDPKLVLTEGKSTQTSRDCRAVWLLKHPLCPEAAAAVLPAMECSDKPAVTMEPAIDWPEGSVPDLGYYTLEYVLQNAEYDCWQIYICGFPDGPPTDETPGGFKKHHNLAETRKRIDAYIQQGRITELA